VNEAEKETEKKKKKTPEFVVCWQIEFYGVNVKVLGGRRPEVAWFVSEQSIGYLLVDNSSFLNPTFTLSRKIRASKRWLQSLNFEPGSDAFPIRDKARANSNVEVDLGDMSVTIL
jgi:hypothetical protein